MNNYEITKYKSGGVIRDRLTNKIVAEWTNWWHDKGIHPKTKEEINYIEKRLNIKIKL
jgi:hypothetical protein